MQQDGDAEQQIHLRGGHALGLIRPAHVEPGGPGGSNHDLGNVFGSNIRVLAKNFFERIDRGVITAAAGVRLESDIERLKPFSEILSQVGEIRLVDESRAKPSVGSFQNIFDAGKTSGCK